MRQISIVGKTCGPYCPCLKFMYTSTEEIAHCKLYDERIRYEDLRKCDQCLHDKPQVMTEEERSQIWNTGYNKGYDQCEEDGKTTYKEAHDEQHR